MSELTERARVLADHYSWSRGQEAVKLLRELADALEQAPTRDAVEDAMISVWDDAISSQWDGIGGMDESISKALDDLGFPTPDPADAEGEQQDG